MEIITISALKDNYMYLVIDKESKECAVVDPVEPNKLTDYASSHDLRITHILTTHHHWDHGGGNNEMKKLLGGELIVCGGEDRVEALNMQVSHGQKFMIGSKVEVECLHTPCHTSGHICYVARCEDEQAVFTGDTLFIAGCGRFFEGTASEMFHALMEILASLPATTKVYCGHEYTVKNLQFALTVDQDNQHIKDKLQWARDRVLNKTFTVPSTIGEELLTNPFMRVNQRSILESCNCSDSVKAMEILRLKKDKF